MNNFIDKFVTYHLPEVNSLYKNGIFFTANQGSQYGLTITAGSTYTRNFNYDKYYIIKQGELRSEQYWHSVPSQDESMITNSWIEVQLKKMWVIPHSYIIVDSSNIYRITNWDLLCSQDGVKYDTIESKYVPNLFKQRWQMESFHVPLKTIKLRKPYRYFRLRLNRPQSQESPAFRLGRFEIFGEVAFCNKDCPNPPKFHQLLTCNIRMHIKMPLVFLFIIYWS